MENDKDLITLNKLMISPKRLRDITITTTAIFGIFIIGYLLGQSLTAPKFTVTSETINVVSPKTTVTPTKVLTSPTPTEKI